MKPVLNVVALLALALLVGCGGRFETSYQAGLDASVTTGWRVADVVASVPAAATTTERNSFAPAADIVWHGEPFGNRKAQVARLVEEGIAAGAWPLDGPRPVTITALVTKFHGVTPRAVARAPQAVHSITYIMQVFDSATGEELTPLIPVRADLPALVGSEAVTASLEGRDQRTRIVAHIAAVTAGLLGVGPDQRRRFMGLGR